MLDSILCNQMRWDISRMFHLSRYYYSTISALQASVRVVRLTSTFRAARRISTFRSPRSWFAYAAGVWLGWGRVRGGRGLDNWGGECQNCDDRGDGRLSAAAHAPHSSVTSRASNKPSRRILNHEGEESTFTFKTPLRHYAKQALTHITHGK